MLMLMHGCQDNPPLLDADLDLSYYPYYTHAINGYIIVSVHIANFSYIRIRTWPFWPSCPFRTSMRYFPRESPQRFTSTRMPCACTRITWAPFLGSEEPSLKLLRSAKLQRTNSSPISNCRRSKLAIFFLRNINYSINSSPAAPKNSRGYWFCS